MVLLRLGLELAHLLLTGNDVDGRGMRSTECFGRQSVVMRGVLISV